MARSGATKQSPAAVAEIPVRSERPESPPVTAQHIVAIPSWYKSARGSGGGYFRDQALALQQAGWRVAMLGPDLYTPRDLRRREGAARRGRAAGGEDDGGPTWGAGALGVAPRPPYPHAAIFAWVGGK